MKLSKPSIKRLSIYKQFLLDIENTGIKSIYSHQIAEKLELTAAIVRKDLSKIGAKGAINEGYNVEALIKEITKILGTSKLQKVILFGAGNIGKAILGHKAGFLGKGFDLVQVYDSDPKKIGKTYAGFKCRSDAKAFNYIKSSGIKIAILAVSKENSQTLANELVKAGITCFLNFSPKRLELPGRVFCESVDFARELEKLSYHINN
jgi:redox-sensing transcriptional repressor